MRIKLDENFPVALALTLRAFGHDVDTVPQEVPAGSDDDTVWAAAQCSERLLITQDLDFSDIRRFLPGSHAGILLIRLKVPGRAALLQHVEMVFRNEDVESWRSCFVVLTDRKLRVRRPKNATIER